MAINFWDYLVNALIPTKEIKDPVLKEIVNSGRSVNYYRPDWVEPQDEEADYKKWKQNMASMYSNPSVKEYPPEFEFRNIDEPLLTKVKDGTVGAATTSLYHAPYDPKVLGGHYNQPNVMFNNDVPLTDDTINHELFHTKLGPDNYWKDWNRLTSRNFESQNEWAMSLARKAIPKRIGFTTDSKLADMYLRTLQDSGGDWNQGLEELGAYMSTNYPDVKPKWMSDRDWQIMRNFISHRMGW